MDATALARGGSVGRARTAEPALGAQDLLIVLRTVAHRPPQHDRDALLIVVHVRTAVAVSAATGGRPRRRCRCSRRKCSRRVDRLLAAVKTRCVSLASRPEYAARPRSLSPFASPQLTLKHPAGVEDLVF
jgi:hypothetical protein